MSDISFNIDDTADTSFNISESTGISFNVASGGVDEVFYVEATSTSYPSNITITTSYAEAYAAYEAGKYLILKVVASDRDYYLPILKATPTSLVFYNRKD